MQPPQQSPGWGSPGHASGWGAPVQPTGWAPPTKPPEDGRSKLVAVAGIATMCLVCIAISTFIPNSPLAPLPPIAAAREANPITTPSAPPPPLVTMTSLMFQETALAMVPATLLGRYCIASSRGLPGQNGYSADWSDPSGQSPTISVIITQSDERLSANPSAAGIRVLGHPGLADTSSRQDQVWTGWRSGRWLFLIWIRTRSSADRRVARSIHRQVAEEIAQTADPLLTGRYGRDEYDRRIAVLREVANNCPLRAPSVTRAVVALP